MSIHFHSYQPSPVRATRIPPNRPNPISAWESIKKMRTQTICSHDVKPLHSHQYHRPPGIDQFGKFAVFGTNSHNLTSLMDKSRECGCVQPYTFRYREIIDPTAPVPVHRRYSSPTSIAAGCTDCSRPASSIFSLLAIVIAFRTFPFGLKSTNR